MLKNSFNRDVLKALIVICVILGLCKVTVGVAAALVAVLGTLFALMRKPGYLAVCYVMFPVFTIVNRAVVGISPIFLMTARIGNLVMIAAMILTGVGFSGRARERLPIAWLFAYCVVACLSSFDGWMPFISYLKIAQFVLFLLGLLFVTRILQQSDKGLYQIRCAFMAIAIIFLLGSLLVRFVPSVGFSMQLGSAASYGLDTTGEELLKSEGTILFNGMTWHSQMLAPVVALMAAWVLCDMLLVERRVTLLHLLLLSVAPVLLYMSRSRGGLLELVAVMGTAIFVCVPRARLARAVKSRLFQMLMLGAALLVVIAVVGQIRNQTISKWLRKTEDVRSDTRSLKDAFTGSRQALIEYNMNDFKLNPLLGKGFQVMRGMEQAYRVGIITWYSASVEKGVTPYVVLGETGVLGAMIFIVFLLSFYSICMKRRYLALLTTFTCVLVANLADSTLFSPGGLGGFQWIVAGIGGFGIDLLSLRQRLPAGVGGISPPMDSTASQQARRIELPGGRIVYR